MVSWRVVSMLLLMVLLSDVTLAERNALTKPTYDTDLGDTSEDIQVLDSEVGRYVYRDSEATVTFDVSTGTYHFRFKDVEDVWQRADWIPRSNVDVVFDAAVTVSKDGRLQYKYSAHLLPTSVRHVTRIMLEVSSDVVDPSGLGVLSPPDRVKHWGRGEWVGKELSKDWGRRLWVWTRYTDDLAKKTVRSSSNISLYSKGLPALGPCWLQGDGNDLFSESEPPYSLSRFHGARSGILKDAAKGLTVAPGPEKVELPALMSYFESSIEQGWLEEGAYREDLNTLLTSALLDHEQGETAQVLHTLSTIQEEVGTVYAQDDSPILSEAYALLHFNISYLVENYDKDVAVKKAVEKESHTIANE